MGTVIKKAILGLLMAVILLVFCVGTYTIIFKNQTTSQASTMEGYVSVYNPGHISSDEAWSMVQDDREAVVLDVRTRESYEERHISGAVNVPFDTLLVYADKNLLKKDATIIIYCFCGDKGGSALAACDQLTELGYTNVFYTEPEDEWNYEGTTVEMYDHKIVTGEEAKAIYDANSDAILLDVRNMYEYEEKHIPSSVLIPVAELEARLSELPDKQATIIVYCRGGVRSKKAYGILINAGYTNVYDMQIVDNWWE